MTATPRAYLDLVRLPNLFTAAADSFAGFLFVGGGLGNWSAAVMVSLASMFLYGGGVVLNDVCDADRDGVERPARPIPSGRVRRTHARVLSLALLAFGTGIAFWVGLATGVVGLTLVVAIILYDVVLKSTAWAPGVMGACRALNLLLGMSIAGLYGHIVFFLPPACMWVYVASVTEFARDEASQKTRRGLQNALIGVMLSVLFLMVVCWVTFGARLSSLGPAVVLLAVVGVYGRRASATVAPKEIQAAVKAFVLSIVLLDACIAGSTRGIGPACMVLVLLLPAMALSRVFRVT